MKILFTADLHLNIPVRNRLSGRLTKKDFTAAIREHNPDAVVIAGDIGAVERSGMYCAALRAAAGDRPLAFCLGNHAHWIPRAYHHQFSSLEDSVSRHWLDVAQGNRIALLDVENADFGDVCITGGYGHYDLGLAVPGLKIDGIPITKEIYLTGGLGGIFWNDFAYIPSCTERLAIEAEKQAQGIATRVDQAIASGKRVIAVTHTCPWLELNGHPLRGNVHDMLAAYSGNARVGRELATRAGHIALLVCGHTHMPVRERQVHGIRSLNVGADYGCFRGVIYDTASAALKWIGEPV
jgi:3',5'-cyclic AMP phosphodiesterase CpdA